MADLTENGRGTLDNEASVRNTPGVRAEIVFRIQNQSGGFYATAITGELGDLTASTTVEFSIATSSQSSSAIDIVVLGTDTGTEVAIKVATGFAAYNTGGTSFGVIRNGRDITLTYQGTAGPVLGGPPNITNDRGNNNTLLLSLLDYEDGIPEAISINEPEYEFNGPFHNVIPEGDPLQGMILQVQNLIAFFDDVHDANTSAAIVAAANVFKDANDLLFPANIIPDHPLGKIPVRGSRKDSNNLVGRGKSRLSYTNQVSNYGTRQLLIRRLDEFFDLLRHITIPANLSLNNIKAFAAELDDSFSLAFGNLRRAQGPDRGPRIYENTIVEGSADQGLLVYCDRMVDLITAFAALDPLTVDPAAILAVFRPTNPDNNIDISKLRLKN